MTNNNEAPANDYLRPLRHLSVYLSGLVKGRLWLKVLVGMGLGLVIGTLLGPSVGLVAPETGQLIGNWLAFPGQLFLATIQMIVIPLVIASVVRGLASSEDLSQLRKLGMRVSIFFVITTAVAASIGLWVGGLINPGRMLTGSLRLPQGPWIMQRARRCPVSRTYPRPCSACSPATPWMPWWKGRCSRW